MRALGIVFLLLPAGMVAAESVITIDSRPVQASTETATDLPPALLATLRGQLRKQGWHDIIYNNESPEKAFLYFTQRTMTNGQITGVRITFWKAIRSGDKTETSTWVINLKPTEVNRFLDEQLSAAALQFKVAKS